MLFSVFSSHGPNGSSNPYFVRVKYIENCCIMIKKIFQESCTVIKLSFFTPVCTKILILIIINQYKDSCFVLVR
jgi:hypothetical protein